MVQDIKEERYSPRFSVSEENYYRYAPAPAPAHSYSMNTVSSYTGYDNMNYQVNNIRRVSTNRLDYFDFREKKFEKRAFIFKQVFFSQ